MRRRCGRAWRRASNGANALELELLVRYGMSAMDAIVAATATSGRLLGIDRAVGTLEPGKLADLIAVEGNPLDDIGVLRGGVGLVMQGRAIMHDAWNVAA